MRNRNTLIIISVLAAIGLFAGVSQALLKAGDQFPTFKLATLDGKTKTNTDFKHKVVMVDVWATWCPPCRAEIPHLIDLHKTYGSKGLAVIGIAVDKEGADKVKPFVDEVKMKYTTLLDPDSDFTGKQLKVRGIPALFLIDRAGVVRYVHVGFTEKSVLEKEIKTLLAE